MCSLVSTGPANNDGGADRSRTPDLFERQRRPDTGDLHRESMMKFLDGLIVGFVAVSMICVVQRFEPNRLLAWVLIAGVYLAGALAIVAKLS